MKSALKISQHLKNKHLSYGANTFSILLYFWICHRHTVIQNLKLFFHELCVSLIYISLAKKAYLLVHVHVSPVMDKVYKSS